MSDPPEPMFDRTEVMVALNEGANLVLEELFTVEHSTSIAARSLVDLVVNAAGYVLDHPGEPVSLDEIIEACWGVDPSEVRGWVSELT